MSDLDSGMIPATRLVDSSGGFKKEARSEERSLALLRCEPSLSPGALKPKPPKVIVDKKQ